MSEQTSNEVSAQEPSQQQQIPPGLDIPVITADEAAKLGDVVKDSSDEFKSSGNGRPLAGAILPGEPSAEQVYKIIFNEPSNFRVEIEGKVFKLVRLSQKDSLFYLSVIAPKIKGIVTTLVPLVKTMAQSYSILQYLMPRQRGALFQIAKGGDRDLMRETLEDIGVKTATENDLDSLITAAVADRKTDFLLTLIFIFGQPLGVHIMDGIESANIDGLIMSLSEQLAEMTARSLLSSAKKTRMKDVTEDWIREQIDFMDTLDCAAIVHMQYQLYKDNPMIRNFLAQIMAKNENTNTGTPTA